MISNIDYDIYKAIQQDKKLTEIYLGYENFDWHYSIAKYSATCTEAIDFTLFDKTICGLLQVDEHLSLEQIGEILGFNVIDDPSQNKYKDNAEYEILKEALQLLQDYEMIDGGDIDFSYCTLTSIGKEYVAKGKKFKIHQNKEFELYFDYTSKEHSKAKENFEFIRGDRAINNESEFDFEDEEFLKSFAEYQIPEIYNPTKLNSFKDVVCIEKNHFKVVLCRIYLLDITTGKLRTVVFEPTGKSVNDFFTNYDNSINGSRLISFVALKYQLHNNYNEENDVVIDLNNYQEKINLATEEGNIEEVVKVMKNYYNNSLYVEPERFLIEIPKFINISSKEVWLLFQNISLKEIEFIEKLIESNGDKYFFIYCETNEGSQEFYEHINNDIKKYRNVYVLLMDTVAEFNILYKDHNGVWSVFKNERLNIPISINGKINSIDKNFIHRNITDNNLEDNYINEYRLSFAKKYVPIVDKGIKDFFNGLNTERETNKNIIEQIKKIDEKLLPFKNIGNSKTYFDNLQIHKNEAIQTILQNREQKIKSSIDKISKKLIENKSLNISFIENLEGQLNKEKENCLEEEFKLFTDLETQLKTTKKDIEIASKRKSIIIDTNILLEEPNIIDMISKDQDIIFSGKVIDELDNLKIKPELKESAQNAIRNIYKHQQDKNIRFNTSKIDNLPSDFDRKSPDNIVLSVALQYLKRNPILLTNDKGMSIKAKTLEIPAKNINELKAILDMSIPKKPEKNNQKNRRRK